MTPCNLILGPFFFLFVFQHQKSSASRKGVSFCAAAPHARETQECHSGNQIGSERGGLQEEPRRFHPAGSGKMRRSQAGLLSGFESHSKTCLILPKLQRLETKKTLLQYLDVSGPSCFFLYTILLS